MSGCVFFVSINATTYFDPLTGLGFALSGEKPLDLHVHECGTIIMAANWNHQEVYSPFWRAYFNEDAGAAICFNGKRTELGPTHLVLLPERVLFDCVPMPGVRHVWIHFSLMGRPNSPRKPTTLSLTPAEQTLWSEAATQMGNAQKGHEYTLRQRCAGLLLMALSKEERLPNTSQSPELYSFLLWIEQSLSQPLGIDSLARRAGMSTRTFLNWFKTSVGTTPMVYLKAQRIREACRLLRFGTESIEQIATATGFANRYHFTRVFREQTGITPAAYRLRGFAQN